MKMKYVAVLGLMLGLSIFARPGDTYACHDGHWVVIGDVAQCVAGAGTVPPGTVPTPLYTAVPLIPDCRPIERQTPEPSTGTELFLPVVSGG